MKELESPKQSVPKGRRFCTYCGEIKRETHFDGDSTHCRACCEKMLHTHVRVYGVLVVAFVLALAFASGVLAVQTVGFCVSLHRADALAADKYLYDACDVYEDAVSGIAARSRALWLRAGTADADGEEKALPDLFEAGTKTWERYAAVYAQTQSDYEAASMLQNKLNSRQMKQNALLSGYADALTAYNAISDEIEQFTQSNPFDKVEDMPYEEILAILNYFEDNFDSRYYQGYAELFKGSATQYYRTDDPTAAYVYLDKALEYLPDEYANIYSSKAEIAQEVKDWTALREASEAIVSHNKNYTDAYEWLSRAASKQGDDAAAKQAAEELHIASPDSPIYEKLLIQMYLMSGDLVGVEAVCSQAGATLDEQASSIFGTMLADQALPDVSKRYLQEYTQYASMVAVMHLLNGDKDKAQKYAFDHCLNYAYYMNYLLGESVITQQMFDIASISSNLTKDKDALDLLSQIGTCSKEAQAVIDGKQTMQQAFFGREADLL